MANSVIKANIGAVLNSYEGDIVTIKSPIERPFIMNMQADINPIQDLHGYDKPWAGGNGKNLIPKAQASDMTLYGLTVTVADDGELTINGTSTGTNMIRVTFPQAIVAGSYTMFMFNPVATNDVQVSLRRGDLNLVTNTWFSLLNTNAYKQFTTTESAYVWQIQIDSGKTLNNFKLKPMMVSGLKTSETFEPYSNICPISGWTEAKVYDDSKYGGCVNWNQLAEPFTSNNWSEESGVTATFSDGVATVSSTTSDNGIQVADYFQYIANHVYLMSTEIKSANNATVNLGKGGYVRLTKAISGSNTWQTAQTIGKNNNVTNLTNLYLYCSGTYSNVSYRNAMIIDLTQCFGSTKADEIYAMEQAQTGSGVAYVKSLFYKDYYAYNAGEETCVSAVNGDEYRQVTIDLGGTRYGGTLDVTTGVLTVTHEMLVFNGGSNESWYINNSGTANWYYEINMPNAIKDLVPTKSNRFESNGIYNGNTLKGIWRTSVGLVRIRTNAQDTVANWKAWLSNNNVQALSELVTPLTVQLTPTQIEALVGENNIWCSTGQTKLTALEMESIS